MFLREMNKPVGDRDHEVLGMGSFGEYYSKIPWYPKFQRENALASFRVQRVLVTQPRPSPVMIKHNFLL
jgi:hypothetical protein